MENANDKKQTANNNSASTSNTDSGNNSIENMFQWLFHEDSSDTTVPASMYEPPEEVDVEHAPELISTQPANEPRLDDDLLLEAEHDFWAPIEGVEWDWIDPTSLGTAEEDNDQVSDLQLDEKPSQVTFHPLVAISLNNRITYEDLRDDYHGDIRSPSEITDVDVESLHTDSKSENACDNANDTISQTSSKRGCICSLEPVQTCDKATSIDLPNEKPDFVALMNNLVAEIKALIEDINSLVHEFSRLTISSEESQLDAENKCCNHEDFHGSDCEC